MKLTLTPDSQAAAISAHRATGWTVLKSKTAPAVVAFKSNEAGRVIVKGWSFTRAKEDFHFYFSTMAKAETYVTEYFRQRAQIATYKATKSAERKAKRAALKAADHWMVGDVLVNSWGYEQTNVDFYEVVTVGAKTITVREVKQNSSDRHGQPGGGYCQPRRGEYCGEPILKQLSEDGGVGFKHGGTHKWDGRPCYTSSYH